MIEKSDTHCTELVWEEVPAMQEPIYQIDERPTHFWESLLYGWQHTLVDISPFVLPLAVANALAMSNSQSAQLINSCLFAMGIATLIQTIFGNRLPIIQGPSTTLIGTLIPIARSFGAATMWAGALIGGLLEAIIGASRILKYLRKLFPIVVSGVVVISIGASLGIKAIDWIVTAGQKQGSMQYLFAAAVVFSIVALQFGCRSIAKGIFSRGAIFFSIWLVGLLLASLLGQFDWQLVAEKPWFSLPQLFPYGTPLQWELRSETLVIAVAAIFIGYLGSMVESIGDYAATCAVSNEPYTVAHMSKGIMAEGLGASIAVVFGGLPCTSYTQNIGIIATTRVASRFVVQIAAGVLLLYGMCPKFGALLVAMPRSVLSAVFVIVCGMIVVSGVQLLRAAPKTTANYVIVAVTLILAIGVPQYAQGQSWLAELPSLVRMLLANTVVLAVLLGVTLNIALNISPGGKDEK